MKIRATENKEHNEQIRAKLRENGGYCPCVPSFARNEDTRCICKEFREAPAGTTCHCGLYYKEEE